MVSGAGCNPALISVLVLTPNAVLLEHNNGQRCIGARLYASVVVRIVMPLLQDSCLIHRRVTLSSILHYFSAAVVAGFSCNGPFLLFQKYSTNVLHNMQSLRTMSFFSVPLHSLHNMCIQCQQHDCQVLNRNTRTGHVLFQLRHRTLCTEQCKIVKLS